MITLYINPVCPYCKKTLQTAHELKIAVTVKDKHDAGVAEEVQTLGGKKQYPFMLDDTTGVHMYESDDIIEYLKAHV